MKLTWTLAEVLFLAAAVVFVLAALCAGGTIHWNPQVVEDVGFVLLAVGFVV